MKKFLIIPILLLVGCAGVQRGIDRTNDWLDKPSTTQPGAPTNAKIITAITPAASAVLGPYSPLVDAAVIGGMLLVHNLDSRRRQKKMIDEIKK